LKYLGFDVRDLTILELQESICTISDSCPFLEEILVTWTCALPITIDDVSSRLKNKKIFPRKTAFVAFLNQELKEALQRI